MFTSHEAWIAHLAAAGVPIDLVVGLRGRRLAHWDASVRPFPAGAREFTLDQAVVQHAAEPYRCVLCHNLADLRDALAVPAPRLLVLHSSLAGRLAEEDPTGDPARYRTLLREVLDRTSAAAVAISPMKAASWGITDGSLRPWIDPADYPPWSGARPAGLRVANAVAQRAKVLRWDLHERAFDGLPVTLVGRNPGRVDAAPASDWGALRRLLQVHRFFVHTADPAFEDGYNLACLEAMAAGLPVLGNRHPTSPVEDGVSGRLADDPAELRRAAERLLADRQLAATMGEAARRRVADLFPRASFLAALERAVASAETCWGRGRDPVTAALAS